MEFITHPPDGGQTAMEALTAPQKIMNFIDAHPTERLFTRRDLIQYGTDGIVDSIIYNLVHKSQRIVRVAQGVFAKKERTTPVSITEVAIVKNNAFDKHVIAAGCELAHNLGIAPPSNEPIFETNGCTTSFKFGGVTIKSKGVSQRKMTLGDSSPGRVIRALWHLGKETVTADIVGQATRHLTTHQRLEVGRLGRQMPAWLRIFFHAWNLLKEFGTAQGYLPDASTRGTVMEPALQYVVESQFRAPTFFSRRN